MSEPASRRPYMPGYGTLGPDEGSGLLPWSWALEQMKRSRNFWLATRWPDGQPHVMPVWAIWHEGVLLFSSSRGSRKARNLLGDPRCVLTTEDSQNPVVVDGTAELLTDEADLRLYLDVMNAKYNVNYGLDLVDPATNCVFRMRPTSVFGLLADDFTGSPTRWSLSSSR